MNEAFDEFVKKIDEFFEKYCFVKNENTGKTQLTDFGVKLFVYLAIALVVSSKCLEKRSEN